MGTGSPAGTVQAAVRFDTLVFTDVVAMGPHYRAPAAKVSQASQIC